MPILYFVAALEGFSTLAVEIIALRLAAPVTGSSSIVTSIFLGIILLALSAGYRRGGVLASRRKDDQILNLLSKYLIFAGVYYALISFGLETSVLEWLLDSTGSYIFTLFTTALLLFFFPVFIASQTIPLLTELLDETSKGKAAGKMLFASTVGSFFGSVLTSIVLFQTLGVNITALLVSCLLIASASLLLRKKHQMKAILVLLLSICLGVGLWVWRIQQYPSLLYHIDSAYQQIQVVKSSYQGKLLHVFLTNEAYASAIFPETKESPFQYIQEAVHIAEVIQPEHLLVIGTAGFTFPYITAMKVDTLTRIDAVDIDPRVQEVAETYFLQTTLPSLITFYPESARYFVRHALKEERKYDFIFVDAFNGKSLPDELTTQEFFLNLQHLLSSDGVVVINFILDRSLESDLARSLFATLESVFGEIRVKQTTTNDGPLIENFIVTTKKLADDYFQPIRGETIYTDDKRNTELDTMHMYWGKK